MYENLVLECCAVDGGYTDKVTGPHFQGRPTVFKLDLAELGPAVAGPNAGDTPGWPFTQDQLRQTFALGRIDGMVIRSHDPYCQKLGPCPLGLDCTDPCNPRLYVEGGVVGQVLAGECWVVLHGC